MREQAKQMKSKRLTLTDVLELYHVPPHSQAIAYDDVDRVATMHFWEGFLAGATGALLSWWLS